jgi:hypothetical protein
MEKQHIGWGFSDIWPKGPKWCDWYSTCLSWAVWKVPYLHGPFEEFPTFMSQLNSFLPSWTGWVPNHHVPVEEFPTFMNRLKSFLPSWTGWRVSIPSWTGWSSLPSTTGWRVFYLHRPVEEFPYLHGQVQDFHTFMDQLKSSDWKVPYLKGPFEEFITLMD